RAAAALALLVSFFVCLVEILAVVGDLANRRISRGRNFDQVEAAFTSQLHGLKRLHNAELAAFFVNHPDLARPNALVYANAVSLPEAAFSDKSPSRTAPAFPGLSRSWPVSMTHPTHTEENRRGTGFKV